MSNDQPPEEYYNLERDFLLPSRTPPLQETRPQLGPVHSPRPIVPCYPSSDSSDEESPNSGAGHSTRIGRRRKGRTTPTLGDGVLILSSDPCLVEVAKDAERCPVASASRSEEEEEGDQAEGLDGRERENDTIAAYRQCRGSGAVRSKSVIKPTTGHRSGQQDDFPLIDDSPASLMDSVAAQSPPNLSRDVPKSKSSSSDRYTGIAPHERFSSCKWDLRPPPRSLPRIRVLPELEGDDDGSLVTSPTLGRYTITPRDVDPEVVLPALQNSPSLSSPAASPQPKPTLPSIRTTIGSIPESGPAGLASTSSAPGRPSASPMDHRHHHQLSSSLQSPQSVMSPPGPPIHFDFRNVTRTNSVSMASELTSATTITISTPATSESAEAPAISSTPFAVETHEQGQPKASSHHGASTRMKPGKRKTQKPPFEPNEHEVESEPVLKPALTNATRSGRVPTGTHKCTFPGCEAAPFQTHYLLNSHMNVHSDARTHFCPVEGCRRGPGGLGFKRKNEMVRHGLVHTSPGYVCPFCPDQQHQYPRPDNLLRHVRAHHQDRSRDDPELCEVLDQRADEGARGGKRRMRS